jgi:glycosyl transferase family 2
VRPKSPTMPTISVIVATRNRRAALERFLESAHGLATEPKWELLIVDNGSTDSTDFVLKAAVATLPLLVITELQRGKSRALNTALKQARGEILLFADDDIVPDRQWLSALHQAADEFPNANVFGCRILVDDRALPRWIIDSYNLKTILTSEQDLGDEVRWFGENQYPVGPSLAVRRRALESSRGEWPINLGPGTKIPLGDERAFLMQISPPGACDRLYVPASVVRHNVGGRKMNVARAAARCFLGGYAAGLVEKHHGRHWAHDGRGAELAWQRYRHSASLAELFCSSARALGVTAGVLSPLPRILYG